MNLARMLLALFALALAAGAEASAWSNLWYTPDQQGQRALEAGNPLEAAKLFKDPRRQAFAEVQAKQYDTAQKRLAHFQDGQSEYNRGNALAKSGKLQAALDAYDAALKHGDLGSALRRDAQHNRDLVAEQLKPPQDQKGGSQQNQQNQQQNQQQGAQPQDSKQPQSAQNGSQSAQQNSGKQGSDAGSDEQKAQRDAAQALKESQTPKAASQTPATGEQGSPPEARRQGAADQPASGDARRQANAGGQSSRGDADSRDRNGQSDLPRKPPTEQTLALDQWLRQIPDDPGGLLRRKFLIEHMLKQNGDVP